MEYPAGSFYVEGMRRPVVNTLRLNPLRLLVELLIILVIVEFGIMLVLDGVAADVPPAISGVLDALLLALIAGPLILWRIRQQSARGPDAKRVRIGAPAGWALLAFFAGVALTGWRSADAERAIEADAAMRFERLSAQLVERVAAELDRSLHPLRGIRGLVEAYPDTGLAAFRRFLSSRNLAEEFPGMHGFGMIEAVPRSKEATFVARERQRGHPDFTVKVVAGGRSRDDLLFLIRLVEPFAENRGAIGLDVGSEAMRNAAAERSRRNNEPAMTRPIVLVQDPLRRPGALIMVPIYRAGEPIDTPEQRLVAHIGWAYSPVVFAELIEPTTRSLRADLDFVLQTTDASGKAVTLVTDGVSDASRTASRYRRQIALPFGGEVLTVDVSSSVEFDASRDTSSPAIIAIAGLLASSLLSLSIWLLLTGRERSLREAERLTEELREATQALVGQERRLSEIVQTSPYAILIVSHGGTIRMHNPAAERIFGYETAAWRDMPLENLLPAGFRARHGELRSAYQRKPDARRMGGQSDLTALTRAGKEIPVEVGLNPIEIDGEPHVLATVVDISERHAIEAELANYRDQLEQRVAERTQEAMAAKTAAEFASAAKSRFLGNMSHELRTPLHAIISFAELGQRVRPGDVPVPEKVQRYFERIAQSGQRLTGLVDNLLRLGSMDFADGSLNLGAVATADLVRDAGQAMTLAAGARQIELRVDVDSGLPALRADRSALDIALRQVLDNAIRYSPEGSAVDITARHAGNLVVIEVTDHGLGIPADELERVFEPFVQSTRTASAAGGKGLGLAVARKIVVAHGGTIHASLPSAGGTCITIGLPVAAPGSSSQHASSPET